MRITILVASLWLVTSSLHGKIVFHSKRDGNREIYTMRSDGRHQTRLTHHAASDGVPAWSPNGRQIAFHSYRDGNAEVYVMDADGSNQRRLTRHPALDGFADWHPDGRKIAFDSNRDGKVNIYVMDADGSHVKQITRLEFASRPKWSPNGKRIAFEGIIDDTRQVYVVNADGTHRFQVSNPVPNAAMFLRGWSPDGKQILYSAAINSSVNDSSMIIATLHLTRREVIRWEQVPIPRMPLSTGAWGADGKSVLFAGKKADHWNIYRFQLRDGRLIQLTDNPFKDSGPHEWNPRLPVSPRKLVPKSWGEIKSLSFREEMHYEEISVDNRMVRDFCFALGPLFFLTLFRF